MEIKDFVTTHVNVQAVQVTKDNLAEVAEWCSGTVMVHHRNDEDGLVEYIKLIAVLNRDRNVELEFHTYPGSWIVKRGEDEFVSLNNEEFWVHFMPKEKIEETYKTVFDIVSKAVKASLEAAFYEGKYADTDVIVAEAAKNVMMGI